MQVNKTCETFDVVLMIICGIGCTLAIIGVAGGQNWSDGDHKREILGHREDYINHEYQTTRAFSVVGMLISVVAFFLSIVRLKFKRTSKTKSCRLLFVSFLGSSFLCILVSVAVWGDFVSHKAQDKKRKNVFENMFLEDSQSTDNQWHLGWGFWTSVAADVFLFIANLIYLIGQDCKTSLHEEAPVEETQIDKRNSESM